MTAPGQSTSALADAKMTAQREEAKYWIEYEGVGAFIDELEARLSSHRFEGEGANRLPLPRHFVTTVYFDTASRKHFKSAIEARQDNLKLRAKEYYDEHSSLAELATDVDDVLRDDAWVWLELKRREGTRTSKQRIRLSKPEVPKFLARRRTVLAQLPGNDVSQCVRIADYCRALGEPLEACCVVNYRRLSFQDDKGELRITIDLDLGFFAPPGNMWTEPGPWIRPRLGARLGTETRVLVEVKRRGAAPSWLEVALRAARAEAAEYSKFLRAAELVYGYG